MTDLSQPVGGALGYSADATYNTERQNKWLFWACWTSIVATAFCFVVRSQVMATWATDYSLTKTQMGELLGVGLWPFSISIILFSLVIDRIGYGTAMIFAFVGHFLSAIITIWAPKHFNPYWSLYIGNLVAALANGTVEAVANPVVATLFSRQKVKWLNMLHAGWPGGLVIGGILALLMSNVRWEYRIALLLIPTVIYGFMMLLSKFPVSERVAAGIPYHEMLKEFGFLGALIVSYMICVELGRDFGVPNWAVYTAIGIITVGFGAYVRGAPGRPLFIFMLLIMIPLATTELGTDSWISTIMTPAVAQIHFGDFHFVEGGVIVLIYTSFIMMVLRFSAGGIVHRISPLGLLACAAAIAAIGLLLLSRVANEAWLILLAATIYGLGKSFFWPTMLGVVSEQSPKGGALTLNATGGVGMLGVGVLGAVFLGFVQDSAIDRHLQAESPAAYQQVVEVKDSVFGQYQAVDPDKVKAQPKAVQDEINTISDNASRGALAIVAILPAVMFVCYLILLAYFKSQGGYKAQVLSGHGAEDEKFTGGVVGPADA